MTKDERRHLRRVAESGCVLCRHLGLGHGLAEIHHLRHGMGMGQRNNNKMVIGLCPEHHRGNTGYHGLGRRAFERMYGVTELDLLEMSRGAEPAAQTAGKTMAGINAAATATPANCTPVRK